MTDDVPLDAHVVAATKVFRDVGFTLAAMQYKRPAEALSALKRYNGLGDNYPAPFAWGYFPNAWCRDNWRTMTPPARASELLLTDACQ